MVAQTQSQSLSPSRPEPRVVAAAFVAIALFAVAWALLHVGFYTRSQVLDTPVYQQYGNAIARGQVPYRDFAVEYPPGALPVFALPGLAEPGHDQDVTTGFRHAFETTMWVCGAAALLLMASALFSLDASRAQIWGALTFAALAPLAIGSVILSRFDLWPTVFVVAALAALVSGRLRLGSGLLGAAIATKLFPLVLAPLFVAYAWRRRGRDEALVCTGILVAVVGVVFLPFVVIAPRGVWHSITVQLSRPLQIESLGSSLLIAAHHLWGHAVTVETSHGSQNLAGHGAHFLAVALTAVQIVALLGIWVAFARGPATATRLVRYSAAALVVFVAVGKVLSPQFLIWLVPIVPLVRGRRGLTASGLLLLALVLTQVWFPFRYWNYANDFEPAASWLVLARNLLLVALAAVLLLTAPAREPARSS